MHRRMSFGHASQLDDDTWRSIADFAFPWTGALACTNRRMETLLGAGQYCVSNIVYEPHTRWIYWDATASSHSLLSSSMMDCRGFWCRELRISDALLTLQHLPHLTHLRVRVDPSKAFCGSSVCRLLSDYLLTKRPPLEQFELDVAVSEHADARRLLEALALATLRRVDLRLRCSDLWPEAWEDQWRRRCPTTRWRIALIWQQQLYVHASGGFPDLVRISNGLGGLPYY